MIKVHRHLKLIYNPGPIFQKKKIMKLSNPMHPGGLEYLGFMSSINYVWKTVQNKVYVQTICLLFIRL